MLSDETIAALTSKYGRIKAVEYNGVDLVFRKPSRAECQEYMLKREGGGAEKIAADEQLAQRIVVTCGDSGDDVVKARTAFLALLEDFPLLVNEKSVGGAIGELAGIIQDSVLKLGRSASRGSGTPQTHTP